MYFEINFYIKIPYIYIYVVRFTYFSVKTGGGGGQRTSFSVLCSPSSWPFLFSVMSDFSLDDTAFTPPVPPVSPSSISSVETPVDRRRFVFSSVMVAYWASCRTSAP